MENHSSPSFFTNSKDSQMIQESGRRQKKTVYLHHSVLKLLPPGLATWQRCFTELFFCFFVFFCFVFCFFLCAREHLSRQLITLLRWGLPSSGMTYHANDGSVSVSHLVQHFHVTQSVLIKATSADAGRGKRRMIAFEERVVGTNRTEAKLATFGGHDFHVPKLQGHKLIDKDDAELFAPLIHE